MHTFNASTREEYETGGDSSQISLILRFLEAGSPLQTDVEVKSQLLAALLFLVFMLNLNIYLWVFINYATGLWSRGAACPWWLLCSRGPWHCSSICPSSWAFTKLQVSLLLPRDQVCAGAPPLPWTYILIHFYCQQYRDDVIQGQRQGERHSSCDSERYNAEISDLHVSGLVRVLDKSTH